MGKLLAISVLIFLSGCATVNYTYHGKACETLGYTEDNRDVLLKCPSPFQNWKIREHR